MLIDRHLPHFDIVQRHRALVAASSEATYALARDMDFVRTLLPVARAISDMRALPPRIVRLVHRAMHLPPQTTFTLDDALAQGCVLLDEKPGAEIVLGAIGKLWKPAIKFLPFEPAEFAAFDAPKYAKLALTFWIEPYGPDKSVFQFEARVAATDDSARAHLRRWYRVVRPFSVFFMRRTLGRIKAAASAPASV